MKKIFSAIDKSIEYTIFLLFLMMVLVGGLQVFNRFIINQSLSWSEEFQRFAHIWLIFLTIPVAYNRGAHIGMTVIIKKFPAQIRYFIELLIHILWTLFSLLLLVYTLQILPVASRQTSAGIGLRMDIVYSGMIIGAVYLLLVSARKLAQHLHNRGSERESS